MSILDQKNFKKILLDTINKIDVDENLLPKINDSDDNAKPFIEIESFGYAYVCVERGQDVFRKFPIDTDALLYEVFNDITDYSSFFLKIIT